MQYELSSELVQMREALRKFVKAELEPLEKAIDATGELPPQVLPLLGKHGYLAMRLPVEVGGAGMGLFPYCLMLEEFSRSHRIFGLLASGGGGLTPIAISRHGTDEQRRKYLAGLMDGTVRTAFALTEPAGGSDNSAMTTRADKVDGGWVINGRKHYINGAHEADFIVVIAITDPVKRTRGGVTAFLVDRGTKGFNITRVDTTMGSDVIKLAEIEFDNCKVADSAVLGNPGQGFDLAKESLRDGRMAVSCSCIGTADRLLEMSAQYAKTRVTFGKPLAERQAIQWMLADSVVDVAAARAMVYETLRQIDAGVNVGTAPSVCKLYCSEMVGRVADRAVQIHGGMGIVQGYPVERMYRDVRHYRIGEGSSEIQRMLIARDFLKAYFLMMTIADTRIVGIGESRCGKVPDRSALQLQCDAAHAGLDDVKHICRCFDQSFNVCKAMNRTILVMLLGLLTGVAGAQDYPTKPVRMVVPYAPAGVADILARVVSEKLGQRLGQTVVVFNREGGGSAVGADLVAKATPDGYTLLIGSTALTMNAAVNRKLPYDVKRDLAPLSLVFEQPAVLVVHPSVAANTVQELIVYARANPGKLRYGSSGVGGVINLVTELFKHQAKVDITHVPYKGVAPAMVELVGGQIELVMSGITNAVPLVKSGKLKALGVTSRKRAAVLPEVRPIVEQGLPDYETSTWYGVFAPAATPLRILVRLNTELVQIANSADVRERFANQGGEARSTTREEFTALIDRDLRTWQTVVSAAGLRAE